MASNINLKQLYYQEKQLLNKAYTIQNQQIARKDEYNQIINNFPDTTSIYQNIRDFATYLDNIHLYLESLSQIQLKYEEVDETLDLTGCLKKATLLSTMNGKTYILGVYLKNNNACISVNKLSTNNNTKYIKNFKELKIGNAFVVMNDIYDVKQISESENNLNFVIIGTNNSTYYSIIASLTIKSSDDESIESYNFEELSDLYYHGTIGGNYIMDERIATVGTTYSGNLISELLLPENNWFVIKSGDGKETYATITNICGKTENINWFIQSDDSNSSLCCAIKDIHGPFYLEDGTIDESKNEIVKYILKLTPNQNYTTNSSIKLEATMNVYNFDGDELVDTENLNISDYFDVYIDKFNNTIKITYLKSGENIMFSSINLEENLMLETNYTTTINNNGEYGYINFIFNEQVAGQISLHKEDEKKFVPLHLSANLFGQWNDTCIIDNGIIFSEIIDDKKLNDKADEAFISSIQRNYTTIAIGNDTNGKFTIANLYNFSWNKLQVEDIVTGAKWQKIDKSLENYIVDTEDLWVDAVKNNIKLDSNQNENNYSSIIIVYDGVSNKHLKFCVKENENKLDIVNDDNTIMLTYNLKTGTAPEYIGVNEVRFTVSLNDKDYTITIAYEEKYEQRSVGNTTYTTKTTIVNRLIMVGNIGSTLVSAVSLDSGNSWKLIPDNNIYNRRTYSVSNYQLVKSNTTNLINNHFGFLMGSQSNTGHLDIYEYNNLTCKWTNSFVDLLFPCSGLIFNKLIDCDFTTNDDGNEITIKMILIPIHQLSTITSISNCSIENEKILFDLTFDKQWTKIGTEPVTKRFTIPYTYSTSGYQNKINVGCTDSDKITFTATFTVPESKDTPTKDDFIYSRTDGGKTGFETNIVINKKFKTSDKLLQVCSFNVALDMSELIVDYYRMEYITSPMTDIHSSQEDIHISRYETNNDKLDIIKYDLKTDFWKKLFGIKDRIETIINVEEPSRFEVRVSLNINEIPESMIIIDHNDNDEKNYDYELLYNEQLGLAFETRMYDNTDKEITLTRSVLNQCPYIVGTIDYPNHSITDIVITKSISFNSLIWNIEVKSIDDKKNIITTMYHFHLIIDIFKYNPSPGVNTSITTSILDEDDQIYVLTACAKFNINDPEIVVKNNYALCYDNNSMAGLFITNNLYILEDIISNTTSLNQ